MDKLTKNFWQIKDILPAGKEWYKSFMKIYQLIYTAVKSSLSDPELDLANQPGYRVYSCSQGLTAEEINEIVRFCGYRLPKNTDVEYSKTPFDPAVPDKFPKTFRTFKTDSGKFVAIQVVYSGYDLNGEEGNFFAHAYVVEDAPEDFRSEMFYESPMFRKYLTEEEQEARLVRYLPSLTEAQYAEGVLEKIDNFVYNHKIQMSSVLEQAMPVFTGDGKTHICINARNQEESDLYVLGLKRILPNTLAENLGVATNNIFLPSSGQNKIVINGTISGKNNISDDDIETRTNCIYIDTQRIETDGVKPMKLFEMSIEELYQSYETFSIKSGRQLQLWLNSYERLNEEGVGDRLRDLYAQVGENLFVQRAETLYERINRADYKQVKFEILDVMFEHIDLFKGKEEEIAHGLILHGIECIYHGEPRNIENALKTLEPEGAAKIRERLEEFIKTYTPESLDEKSGALLLRVFSLLKSATESRTWKSFFNENEEYISKFLQVCATVMINDTAPVTFTAPAIWLDNDMAEVIAMFDASTEDVHLKKACRKYILENKTAPWSEYGIILQKKRKSREEAEEDIQKIRKLLNTVGYAPYQRTTYKDVKYDIINEMNSKENPLLIARLLNAFYEWQGSDSEVKSEKLALKISGLILELRETQNSCYNYVFPKLALEILDTPGLYHELMINPETMDEDFWYWFYIGYKRSLDNELISVNYKKVATENKTYLRKFPFFRNIKNINNKRKVL